METKKRIIILGATGSVGTTVLQEISAHPDYFDVVGISCHSNVEQAEQIARQFSVKALAISDEKVAPPKNFPGQIFRGTDGLRHMVEDLEFSTLVVALSGINGLGPVLRAIERSKTIIIANKEILVAGGSMIMDLAKARGATILPLDSEHNAIFQCLQGEHRFIRNLWLTASGGIFWNQSPEAMENATVEMVLQHPKWSMGQKITVDSSTMANKGLEIIEAMHLFAVGPERIKIALHPACVVHSLVEFCDGNFLGQLASPSMRYAARHCLFYPERIAVAESSLDLYQLSGLQFFPPNFEQFPCLELAIDAARKKQSKHIAYNAANEIAVHLFLQGKIKLQSIAKIIAATLAKVEDKDYETLEEILAVDQMVRSRAEQIAKKFHLG
jgi:1-deoxy-D-xylulose-5-phosphate reductoisomerase